MPDVDRRPATRRTEGLRVVGAGEGEQAWMSTNLITVQARAADTGGAYGLIVSRAPVGSSPPLHVHRSADEAIWMSAGRIRIVCGDDDFHLTEGGFAFLPRGVPHTFLVEEAATMVGLLSPGGSEQYMLDAGLPVTGPTSPTPDIERMQRAGQDWDVEVVGPPLTPA